MNNIYYGIYAVLLALLAIYTGEIVTFIMLGLVLISLHNIHRTLKQYLKENQGYDE